MTEYQIFRYFPSWREAVHAAGLEPNSTNIKIDDDELLRDWGELVRRKRRIPTRVMYRLDGKYSPGTFETHFGPWSVIPTKFQEFAQGKPEWADVLALLPLVNQHERASEVDFPITTSSKYKHSKLKDRSIYGNPIDFRGLRHEPVNENGVVFLFGMVARELGYLVEAIQAGFPDCEAKRQIDNGRWQRVWIEFEFESRNFRDHGHPVDGCDVIVCWRDNWADRPTNLEVVELSSVLKTLANSED